MRIQSVLANLGFLALLGCSAMGAQLANQAPQEIYAELARAARGATVLTKQDIDQVSCGNKSDHPGLVKGDFNGDGKLDYAALVKLGGSESETLWEGKLLKRAAFAVFMFVANSDSGYRAVKLTEDSAYMPFANTIAIFAPATVKDRESGLDVTLVNPGITLSYCEKSAAVYYLDNKNVRSIAISD